VGTATACGRIERYQTVRRPRRNARPHWHLTPKQTLGRFRAANFFFACRGMATRVLRTGSSARHSSINSFSSWKVPNCGDRPQPLPSPRARAHSTPEAYKPRVSRHSGQNVQPIRAGRASVGRGDQCAGFVRRTVRERPAGLSERFRGPSADGLSAEALSWQRFPGRRSRTRTSRRPDKKRGHIVDAVLAAAQPLEGLEDGLADDRVHLDSNRAF
jgi:hypothetical protein